MTLDQFRQDLDAEMGAILSPDFEILLQNTTQVPTVDDQWISYPNLETNQQKCKLLTTCVLHVDIRDSTAIGAKNKEQVMAGLYSAFVRGMARCARYYSGELRHIIGDRVSVVFDTKDCFVNAVRTATLMNSFVTQILNKYFESDTIRCGIGIDHGAMLVAKVGLIRQGQENYSHKDLVWLGRPSNVASKLSDLANKTVTTSRKVVYEGIHYAALDKWAWTTVEMETFLNRLTPEYITPFLKHSSPYFSGFSLLDDKRTTTPHPILITDSVYQGFKAAVPTDDSFTKNLWRTENIIVPGYNGAVYGTNMIFTAFA